MSTPRVDALTAWAAALAAMTGVRPWGGSYENAPTVAVDWKDPRQVGGAYPYLFLYPFQGSHLQARGYFTTQEASTDRFVAVVTGYARGTAAVPRIFMAQHLLRDCKVTLIAASGPGLVVDADSFEEPDETIEFSDDAPDVRFDLPFTAHLRDTLT